MITNTQFLRRAFDGCAGHVLGTAFEADPTTANGECWTAREICLFEPDSDFDEYGDQFNTYVCISTFKTPRRRATEFLSCPMLVLDDIGSGPGAKSPGGGVITPPSYLLETSPGCFQVGYFFTDPISDAGLIRRVQDAMTIGDPGSKSVTRYVRLPVGRNTKKKYGGAFAHRLRLWRPERRYTVDRLVDDYGLTLADAPPEHALTAFDGADPYVAALDSAGLLERYAPDKRAWHVTCPWQRAHTAGGETAMYWLGGGFKCHHGSCADRNFVDVKAHLAVRHHVDVSALDAELDRSMAHG